MCSECVLRETNNKLNIRHQHLAEFGDTEFRASGVFSFRSTVVCRPGTDVCWPVNYPGTRQDVL